MNPKHRPSKRFFSRILAAQALYAAYMNADIDIETLSQSLLRGDFSKTAHKADTTFFTQLFQETLNHQDSLENTLTPYLDRQFNSLDVMVRLLLLLSAHECLFMQIPKPVVINEYVQIAKLLGSTESYRYVNRILDQLSLDSSTDLTHAIIKH